MPHGAIPGSSGTVHSLRWFGDPLLHRPAAPAPEFGPGLARLVEDLFATMYARSGVGMAAPQIGADVRVFVHDCPDDEDRRHLGHVVNPRLVAADGPLVRGPEGCLSLPGTEAGTPRFDRAVVEGFDVTGAPLVVEGTGFFARCLQHEIDHLDGVVYTDRLTGLRRRRALRGRRKLPGRSGPAGPALRG
ncbi:peptide deformylase [Streptomyces sp. SL13]|uniref:Peptide deformylase n=1 Tax=Streptantibioticus silvisoli TaxID=2705255 RepID=A0AA90H7L2_9ACTN|nr:peptide deformylase [Streptantibioticus silvisoli]MDI5961832.1 peptide deformylase [Streptantibioticus silvisoli]MDI5973386.1 peptide deformylase [Streptantibioticus silvisoli]